MIPNANYLDASFDDIVIKGSFSLVNISCMLFNELPEIDTIER